MKKIGIFYGPTEGSTEDVAQRIAAKIGESAEALPVKDAKPEDFLNYDFLILGVATVGNDTWDSDHPGNDWSIFLANLSEDHLKGKKVALFGLGNQIFYPRNFVDDMGSLYGEIIGKGAEIFGEFPVEGYEFNESTALKNDKFVGLPIDEDTQDELTDKRIDKWIELLKPEF